MMYRSGSSGVVTDSMLRDFLPTLWVKQCLRVLHKRKDDLLFCNPGLLILAYRLAGRPGHEILAGNFTQLLYASQHSS